MKKNKIFLAIAFSLVAFASVFTMFIPKSSVYAEEVNDSYSTNSMSMDIPFYFVEARVNHQDLPLSAYSRNVFLVFNQTLRGDNDTDYALINDYDNVMHVTENYYSNSGYYVYTDFSPLGSAQNQISGGYIRFGASDFVFQRNYYMRNADKYCLFMFMPNNVSSNYVVQWELYIGYYPSSGNIQSFQTYRQYINANQFYLEDILLGLPDVCYISELTIKLTITPEMIAQVGHNWRAVFNCTATVSRTLAYERAEYIGAGETIYEIDWFENIVQSIDSLLSIEILPEISFYDILIVCIAIPLLIGILKVWLGG